MALGGPSGVFLMKGSFVAALYCFVGSGKSSFWGSSKGSVYKGVVLQT